MPRKSPSDIYNASRVHHETRFPGEYAPLNSPASLYVSEDLPPEEDLIAGRDIKRIPEKSLTSTSHQEQLIEKRLLESTNYSQSLATRPPPNRHKTWRQQHLSGCSVGVAGCLLLVTLALLLNLGFTIYAAVHLPKLNGFALLYQGSCNTSARLILWFHVAINLLSTALLSASNYCMQILSSPTRKEVDKAHSKHRWLDIGLQSLRNLSEIEPTRWKMWLVLVLSSAPLHLMYNSAAASMLSAYEYRVVFATPDFLLPQLQQNVSEMLDPQVLLVHDRLQNDSQGFEKLDVQDCVDKYSQMFVTDRRDVVVILQPDWYTANPNANPLRSDSLSNGVSGSIVPWFDVSVPLAPIDLSVLMNINPLDFDSGVVGKTVEYCLSQTSQEGCRVLIAVPVLAIIILCNMLKAITILMTFKIIRNSQTIPLITIGDAIQSFLENPDVRTEDMCLYDRRMIVKNLWQQRKKAQQYYSHNRLWFNASSPIKWILTNLLFNPTSVPSLYPLLTVISAIAILALLGVVMSSISKPLNLSQLAQWTLGFGAISETTTISLGTTGKGLSSILSSLILVNLPRALFSLLYLSYNSHFTSMYAASEWSRFAHQRKTLRVTSPTGDQRSTYWLQMPSKAALPLVFTASLFHWLISQSFYFSRVAVYDLNGNYVPQNDISTTGYSFPPLLIIVCVGTFVVAIFGIGSGFGKFVSGLPVAGGCSAVISAACHGGDEDEALRPLKWGAICEMDFGDRDRNLNPMERETLWDSEDRPGHCAFSSLEVVMPIPDHFYK
ncbi:hypothetical protein G7Y89_g5184 [Cudoniella acicularis]|uniref:DUF6536 domain-containing protein n=1 Tax=Cudoniella acicularis TaxID=354080 RepID=A0A8H4RQ52_9HELO|nr:hypothetical protein G7Y89_g5184 [Cudoniella acicularis]